MEKKLKPAIVWAQESKHIASSCWGKQRCAFFVRNHVGIGAVEKVATAMVTTGSGE